MRAAKLLFLDSPERRAGAFCRDCEAEKRVLLRLPDLAFDWLLDVELLLSDNVAGDSTSSAIGSLKFLSSAGDGDLWSLVRPAKLLLLDSLERRAGASCRDCEAEELALLLRLPDLAFDWFIFALLCDDDALLAFT